MALVGEHRDAWGKTTDGCEAHREHGRHGTWTLCGKEPVAVGVYGNGDERRLCKSHRSGALRKTTFYANEIVVLKTLDGSTTHELVRESGRKGYMKGVT